MHTNGRNSAAEPVVYVVDDNKELCSVLTRVIEANGLRCRAFDSAERFLESFEKGQPGCVVLDVRMPGMSGLELQEFLKRNGSSIPVLILTGHADVPVAIRAMKTGALEFLEKPVSNQILLEHIRRALQIDAQSRAANNMVDLVRGKYEKLTPREKQVMGLVVQGNANRHIGDRLGLRQKTVEVHRAHVMQKMEAKSLAELVRMAVLLEN